MTKLYGTMAMVGLAARLAVAADTAPSAVALAAEGGMLVGNSTRVVVRIPSADPDVPPVDVPAPIAAGGALLLDERSLVGDVHARAGVRTRLLATIDGDVTATEGGVQLGPQSAVTGDVTGEQTVVVGLSSHVAGAVTSRRGGVTVARLSRVDGDVFAARDWRGDRDITVGSPGTVLAVKGRASVRDRSEYFATIRHAGPIAFLGVGDATLHAGVERVAAGDLATPPSDGFALGAVTVPDVVPGTEARTVSGRGTLLPPGRWGAVMVQQGGVLKLARGTYALQSLSAASDARIVVEPGSAPLELRVAGDVRLGRRVRIELGTKDEAERQAIAATILTVVGGSFRLDQDGVWAGTVLAGDSVVLGKHVTLTGAAASAGTLAVGRDGEIVWVPSTIAW